MALTCLAVPPNPFTTPRHHKAAADLAGESHVPGFPTTPARVTREYGDAFVRAEIDAPNEDRMLHAFKHPDMGLAVITFFAALFLTPLARTHPHTGAQRRPRPPSRCHQRLDQPARHRPGNPRVCPWLVRLVPPGGAGTRRGIPVLARRPRGLPLSNKIKQCRGRCPRPGGDGGSGRRHQTPRRHLRRRHRRRPSPGSQPRCNLSANGRGVGGARHGGDPGGGDRAACTTPGWSGRRIPMPMAAISRTSTLASTGGRFSCRTGSVNSLRRLTKPPPPR